MNGALPPSSNNVRFRPPAAAWATRFPVATEPVKATSATVGLLDEGGTDRAIAGEQVERAGWQAGILTGTHEQARRQWRFF